MKQKIFFFVITLLTNLIARAADETIDHHADNGVTTFQKGCLVVQYDTKDMKYSAFKQKITREIDKDMLRIKRENQAAPKINAEKAYWDLNNAYWAEKENDRDPQENE